MIQQSVREKLQELRTVLDNTQLRRFARASRGISEIVGYSILFGVILSTVIALSVTAVPIVEDSQSYQTVSATENMMLYLDEDVQQVQGGVDSKTSQLRIPAGQLRQANETTLTFDPGGEDFTVSVRPIEYEAQDGTELLYTGAFIGQTPAGDFGNESSIEMTHAEHQNAGNPVFTIPGLATGGETSAYAASQRAPTVRFDVKQNNTNRSAQTRVFDMSSGDLTIEVDSPQHAAAWEAYFAEHPAISESNINRDPGDTTFDVTVDASEIDGDTVTVTTDTVIIDFSRV